jgi:hypothetical protein
VHSEFPNAIYNTCYYKYRSNVVCRSRWPSGLRHKYVAARFLRLWVRIPPGAWISICCECCQVDGLMGDGLITRLEEPYRLWWIVVCDLETSWMRRPWPTGGCRSKKMKFLLVERECLCHPPALIRAYICLWKSTYDCYCKYTVFYIGHSCYDFTIRSDNKPFICSTFLLLQHNERYLT